MEEDCSLESLKAKSNEELMRLAQKDVKGAYDIIYERLFGKFVNVACKILRNRTDAEDAAQKALMTGYIKRGQFLFLFNTKFNASAKVETWLYRILINICLDETRKNSKELSEELENFPLGIKLHPYMRKKVYYDDKRHLLILRGFLSPDEKDELLGLSKDIFYQEAIEGLYQKCQELERKKERDLGKRRGNELFDPDIENEVTGIDVQSDKITKFQLISLQECIKMLPEEEKEIFELREVYEIPYKEIVKITEERFGHSSLGNIKNKADSAKKKLKDCIEKKLLSFKEMFEK